jgi:hypothetical protein
MVSQAAETKIAEVLKPTRPLSKLLLAPLHLGTPLQLGTMANHQSKQKGFSRMWRDRALGLSFPSYE